MFLQEQRTKLYRVVENLYTRSNIYFLVRRPHVFSNISPSCRMVLEIGCGDRILWTRFLANRSERVIALDVDADNVFTAKKLSERAHTRLENAVWIVADATALPFKSKCFDAVVCIDVIEHVEDDVSVIEEVSRVLASGGKSVITTMDQSRKHYIRRLTFSNHVREYTIESLKNVCSAVDSVTVVKFFAFYSPLATAMRELQLLVIPTVRLPAVNLALNFPLAVIAQVGEVLTLSKRRQHSGIGLVLQAD